MRRQELGKDPGLGMSVHDIRGGGQVKGWSPWAPDIGDAVVLMRMGGFRRHASGQDSFLDAAGGYLTREGLEERFAYPSASEIRYTWIMLTPDAHDEYVAGVQGAPGWMLAITALLDLRHRELLSACRRGADRLEVGERLQSLLAALPPRTERPGPGAPPTTRVIHRRMTIAVQEALSCGHLNDSVVDLARLVGASPKHVGRIFRHVTGRTISEYRNELRVRAVLEHMADGGAQLAELATMYGFADHAHLTRTVRKHLAETPSALRARLDRRGL
ncbi:helix-turn-helix transcriptional regulator [Nonomuraea sp. SMC257]|uniref:Helix-turn-helix transcriptional regulator n=1 Tax=Nonomuraea montanisoli TaxID=2741721 RepID=A0A7Y6M571_9ACTN|nr:helix-turn-helix domain-containing protein [Nonomuraea montanisoli]NUW35057.1 helix-turn-helix transcriptional regulator [Nonomuraea montanisoli]